MLRGGGGAGEDEDARGIAVEAMDETRPLASERERIEHRVQMPADLAAALNGESGRLVEDEDERIDVQHPRLQLRRLLGIERNRRAQRR